MGNRYPGSVLVRTSWRVAPLGITTTSTGDRNARMQRFVLRFPMYIGQSYHVCAVAGTTPAGDPRNLKHATPNRLSTTRG